MCTITETLHTITETLIQTRKLTGYKGFACEYRLLRDSMEFCLIVSEFP